MHNLLGIRVIDHQYIGQNPIPERQFADIEPPHRPATIAIPVDAQFDEGIPRHRFQQTSKLVRSQRTTHTPGITPVVGVLSDFVLPMIPPPRFCCGEQCGDHLLRRRVQNIHVII